MSLNNFRAGGSIFMKLLQTSGRNAGVITRVQLLEGPPPKIWEGQKNVQISARFFYQLSTLIANISGMDRHIEHLRKLDQPQPLQRWAKKALVNFGPQTKKFYWLIGLLTNSRRYFSGHHISAIRGCCSLKFLNALEIDQGYLAHTTTGTGIPQKNLIAKI